ncbi:hypothetical protein P3T36_004542 [Kitasatospora sp. MAP12-15]|uniref:DUF397 domain-containing protein n=1 Tax=unclassified Kitasatospora TaxID=2633591 RepID=UPI00247438F9|nr:DUF397 domain-containing protein [Kitasatospora sp. MAP12-44]MDH6111388.1 hypothetical protein [Kitasatospora sp. MAP12-44]
MQDSTLNQGARGWRKSKHSSGEDGNCVEAGQMPDVLTAVRDTKGQKAGPVLTFGSAAFVGLVADIKAGRLTFGLV